MGRKSTKEEKNIYQLCREEMGLTREKASELLGFISPDRIEKIESEKSQPQPGEILAMSECYKSPYLCNYYCSQKCPIGQHYIPEVKPKGLSQIVLEMLASLNSIEKKKNRLIEITADGNISEDEFAEFATIQKELKNISLAVNTLQFWVEQTIANKNFDLDKLTFIRNSLK